MKEFGHTMKQECYQLDTNITFCNHGSYGSVPNTIFDKKVTLQKEMENCPDKWFRKSMFDKWESNRKLLADYLKVNSENLFICDSATEGINCSLKSIDFNGSQDAILCSQYTYQAILNTIDYVATYRQEKENQVNVFKVPCIFPLLSKEKLIKDFDQMCHQIVEEKKLRLRLAVIDHISSATAVLFPIKELIELVRKWTNYSTETLILIDGAHAIGQVKLNLDGLDCDFYVSNLHKWFCAPKGCCFLYLKDKKRLEIGLEPNFISHGYKKDMSYNFCQRATCDKSSWYVIDECIKFYEETLGGLTRIQHFTSAVLKQAVQMLVGSWKTSCLELSADLEAPNMKMIKLPVLRCYQINNENKADKVCPKLMEDLLSTYKVVVCIVYVQEELYCRISCFVYNQLDDYVKLRDAVLNLI